MPKVAAPSALMHPDYLRLEQELAHRVAAVMRGTGPGSGDHSDPQPPARIPRILVLAASSRQVRRLRDSLAQACGGLAGVEVRTHLAVARELSGRNGAAPARAASRPLREALVQGLVEDSRAGDGPLVRYLRERPSGVGALTGLFGELREAGITPGELAATTRTPFDGEVATLFSRYEEALVALGNRAEGGWADRAAVTCRAVADAPAAPPYDAIFHFGAYDLLGMNLDLVRALPCRTPVVWLVPADTEAPSWAFARDFVRRHLDAEPLPLDDGPDPPRPFVAAARAFRDWDAKPQLLPPERIRLMHAQGPETELSAVARECLRLVTREGVRPERIGVVARTLDPYAVPAELVFARHGLAVDSSTGFPLAREPRARAFLLLLQTMAGDFERRPVIDLARSAHLRVPEALTAGFEPDRWDRWSRRHGLVRGAKVWIEQLPRLAAADAVEDRSLENLEPEEREARRAARGRASFALSSLIETWNGERETWSRLGQPQEHAAFLHDLGQRWIHDWDRDDDAGRALRNVLGDVAALAAVEEALAEGGAGRRSITPARVVSHLERALAETRLPWSTAGGIRLLDVMQARGAVFEHLFLIGFNADLLPRRPRDDVFLPDALRRALRDATGKPLAVRGEGVAEEHLLLAQTFCAADTHLTVSWQRADVRGRTRAVSLAMRELERVLPRDNRDDRGPSRPMAAAHLPTHPVRAARDMATRDGMLTLEEAALVIADASRREAAAAVGRLLGSLRADLQTATRPGLQLVSVIDRFEGDSLDYDGKPGEGHRITRPFSATSLERLGRCPQQFFFQDVLRVRPLDDAAEELRLDHREVGILAHDLLEQVYRDLLEQGLVKGDTGIAALISAGQAALETHWNEVMDPLARRMRPRFPRLWAAVERTWRREMETFLEQDLTRLADRGWRVMSVERDESLELVLADPLSTDADATVTLSLFGRFDRTVATAEGSIVISDYKTSGNLSRKVEPKPMLSGDAVQLPLYVLMAEQTHPDAEVMAELLGVGPGFAPDRGFVRAGAVTLSPEDFPEDRRESFRETLAVLATLAHRGRFPFRPERHCQWCSFREACRRFHVPSRQRHETQPAFAPYFQVKAKSTRNMSIRTP